MAYISQLQDVHEKSLKFDAIRSRGLNNNKRSPDSGWTFPGHINNHMLHGVTSVLTANDGANSKHNNPLEFHKKTSTKCEDTTNKGDVLCKNTLPGNLNHATPVQQSYYLTNGDYNQNCITSSNQQKAGWQFPPSSTASLGDGNRYSVASYPTNMKIPQVSYKPENNLFCNGGESLWTERAAKSNAVYNDTLRHTPPRVLKAWDMVDHMECSTSTTNSEVNEQGGGYYSNMLRNDWECNTENSKPHTLYGEDMLNQNKSSDSSITAYKRYDEISKQEKEQLPGRAPAIEPPFSRQVPNYLSVNVNFNIISQSTSDTPSSGSNSPYALFHQQAPSSPYGTSNRHTSSDTSSHTPSPTPSPNAHSGKVKSKVENMCTQCGKHYSSSSALVKHKLIHSDERKYVCQICYKAFKRQDHLNGHMYIHRDKKPFECPYAECGKGYRDMRSLRRHFENHHSSPTCGSTPLSYMPQLVPFFTGAREDTKRAFDHLYQSNPTTNANTTRSSEAAIRSWELGVGNSIHDMSHASDVLKPTDVTKFNANRMNCNPEETLPAQYHAAWKSFASGKNNPYPRYPMDIFSNHTRIHPYSHLPPPLNASKFGEFSSPNYDVRNEAPTKSNNRIEDNSRQSDSRIEDNIRPSENNTDYFNSNNNNGKTQMSFKDTQLPSPTEKMTNPASENAHRSPTAVPPSFNANHHLMSPNANSTSWTLFTHTSSSENTVQSFSVPHVSESQGGNSRTVNDSITSPHAEQDFHHPGTNIDAHLEVDNQWTSTTQSTKNLKSTSNSKHSPRATHSMHFRNSLHSAYSAFSTHSRDVNDISRHMANKSTKDTHDNQKGIILQNESQGEEKESEIRNRDKSDPITVSKNIPSELKTMNEKDIPFYIGSKETTKSSESPKYLDLPIFAPMNGLCQQTIKKSLYDALLLPEDVSKTSPITLISKKKRPRPAPIMIPASLNNKVISNNVMVNNSYCDVPFPSTCATSELLHPKTAFFTGTNSSYDILENTRKPLFLNLGRNNNHALSDPAVSFKKLLTELPQPKINVGPQFQATTPTLLTPYMANRDTHRASLMWKPLKEGAERDKEIDAYLEMACSRALYGGSSNKEYALHILQRTRGNIKEAVRLLLTRRHILRADDPTADYHYSASVRWTSKERFAFRQTYHTKGKVFSEIQKAVGTKSTQLCIEFYYTLKTSPLESRMLKANRHGRRSQLKIIEEESEQDDEEVPPTPTADVAPLETMREPVFECDYPDCCARFVSKQALYGHIRIHGGSLLKTHDVTRPHPKTKLTSPVTPKTPVTKATNKDMIGPINPDNPIAYRSDTNPVECGPEMHTMDDSANPFQCMICGRQFDKMRSRSAHMKAHVRRDEKVRTVKKAT